MSQQSLVPWLGEHLLHLCSPAQLGIVCAELAIELWKVAPAQLQPAERVDLLIEHLIATKRLEPFAAALLRDENHRDEALRLGLRTLIPAEQVNPATVPAPHGSDPLTTKLLPIDEASLQARLDAFDERLAAEDPLGAYTLLADGLGGFAHLGCRLGRSRLLLELIRRLWRARLWSGQLASDGPYPQRTRCAAVRKRRSAKLHPVRGLRYDLGRVGHVAVAGNLRIEQSQAQACSGGAGGDVGASHESEHRRKDPQSERRGHQVPQA